MNFVLNVAFQFIIIFFGKGFSYKNLILFSLIISCISMVCLPITVGFITGFAGFAITCVIILFQGLANAIILSCFYGILGYMKDEHSVAFTTGSGIAGMLMNIIKYILLIIFTGEQDDSTYILSAIIFFVISTCILIATIVVLIVYLLLI